MFAVHFREAFDTLAVFSDMLDIVEYAEDIICRLSFTSSFVNNDNKKDNNFDTWGTDSSGICTGPLHDSVTREVTSSLSSNSIDTNILDYCQTPDKLNEEVTDVAESTISEDIEKEITCNALSETVYTNNSDDESYHSCSLSELNSISPSSILKEVSNDISIQTLESHKTNESFDSRSHEMKDVSKSENETRNENEIITKASESKSTKTILNTLNNDKTNESGMFRNEFLKSNCSSAEVIDFTSDAACHPTKENKETISNSSDEALGKKVTSATWNFDAILESLYPVPKPVLTESLAEETHFEIKVHIESRGAFCNYPEGLYQLLLQHQSLWLTKENDVLFTMPLNHSEVCVDGKALQIDNKLGRCIYLKCNTPSEAESLKEEIEHVSSKNTVPECISLVHYPLKSHRNVIIIDLGSCSTRAGILMDQPTLPFIFFPSVCATDKTTGKHVYGKEALHQEIRRNSIISFPLRSSIKIIKHNIEVELLEGLFKKIFYDLRVDPKEYTVQVCLPRTLSINTQNALVKLLLEDLQVPSVSLTHQALLTLYAHKVGTGIVVDIGDRMEIVPVVDGFIVENGVTRLPYGGQRLIHHMKHALAEKHISLSNEIESFVVQYISEKLCYVAENYDSESEIAIQYPQSLRKSVTLETFAKDINCLQDATLEEARFKIPEGLFKPELWGLDNQGVHQLVQKAIQTASVDARKKIAENIYISGGVTMIPGFVERLTKEVTNLNAPRINPNVIASNYRYHCTYIGACEFAGMEVFPNVCLTKEEYRKSHITSLKKFVLCF